MAEATPPRRIVSTATTVAINSSATPLKTAIANTLSGGFSEFMPASFWTRTQDPREPTANENIAGANYRWTAPTEQGDTLNHGLGYTMLDWGGKICWDSIGRSVMFAGCGANPQGTTVRAYSYQYNKFSSYSEITNAWTQERGIRGANEEADPDVIVHLLGNHAIDVTGRRFFKKKFRESPGRVLVKNLTTGAWSAINFSGVSEASYNAAGGLEFVPGRGSAGMLWGSLWSTAELLYIAEIDPNTGAGSTLVPASSLGNQSMGGSGYGVPCVYNPRAFGGAGGVLMGFTNTYKLTVPPTGTPTVYTAGVPTVNMTAATGHRVCRDPVGDGWYHFVSSTGRIYRTAGNAGSSTWTEVATMPTNMAAMPNMVLCPIDREGASDYGAIWVLCSYGTEVGLYGSTNGHNCWLFKP